MINELIQKVFATRDAAHRKHWKTKSFAEHSALSAFYQDVIEAIDSLVENYIGMFGQFDMPAISSNYSPEDMVAHLQEEADWIETNRDEICGDSASIGNLVDNLTTVYTKTIFLLRLK